jgi:hypothetical protein
MAVPPADPDLVRMYLDGVSRNVHLPATVAVNGAESFVAAGRLVVDFSLATVR